MRWQEHPPPLRLSLRLSVVGGRGATPACFLPWVLWTAQEMLTGERERPRPRGRPLGLAAASVYLRTLEAAHNQFLLTPLPGFPETPKLHAAAQSSRSGPQPAPRLTLPPL